MDSNTSALITFEVSNAALMVICSRYVFPNVLKLIYAQ